MLAAILIRSAITATPQVKETLKRLNFHRKNSLILIQDTPANAGMLKKVESYITYGVVSEELAKQIVEKRGVLAGELVDRKPSQTVKKHRNTITLYGKVLQPSFRLSPPRGGFERGGIKTPYSIGGVLGDRAEKIETLITRMM